MNRQEVEQAAELRRQRSLDEHEHAFLETENPLFAFEALSYCRADQPLPGWIQTYLMKCRNGLVNLTFTSANESELPAAEAVERIPTVLGFTRAPNWNAIAERRRINRDSEVAVGDLADDSAGIPQRVRLGRRAQETGRSKDAIKDVRGRARDVWGKPE
jgi:hypothetical protein